MTKKKFLRALRMKLVSLPAQERNDIIDYYSEIIGDGVESGKSEEETVASLGSVDEIAKRIIAERRGDGVKNSGAKNAAVATGLVLGSPVWLPVLIVLFVCCIAVAIAVVSVLAALFAAALALMLAFIGGLVSCFMLLSANPLGAVFQVGAGLLSLGLGILLAIALVKVSKYFFKAVKFLITLPVRLFSGRKGGGKNV